MKKIKQTPVVKEVKEVKEVVEEVVVDDNQGVVVDDDEEDAFNGYMDKLEDRKEDDEDKVLDKFEDFFQNFTDQIKLTAYDNKVLARIAKLENSEKELAFDKKTPLTPEEESIKLKSLFFKLKIYESLWKKCFTNKITFQMMFTISEKHMRDLSFPIGDIINVMSFQKSSKIKSDKTKEENKKRKTFQ